MLRSCGSGLVAALACRRHLLTSARPPESIAAVVFDSRWSESVQFAGSLRQRGVRVFDLDTDTIRLWRGSLQHIAAQDGARLTGLTSYTDFLLLRGSAAELRLSVLWHGILDAHSNPAWHSAGPLHSWIVGRRNLNQV